MNIECEKEKMIFRNEKDGKVFYSIGLSKKNQDGIANNFPFYAPIDLFSMFYTKNKRILCANRLFFKMQ